MINKKSLSAMSRSRTTLPLPSGVYPILNLRILLGWIPNPVLLHLTRRVDEGAGGMGSEIWRRSLIVLIVLCAIPAAILASRVFYFQEIFFAFLLFAVLFLILVIMAGIAVAVWMVYAHAIVYVATLTVKQGHRALPTMRAMVLWLAPTVIKTAGAVMEGERMLLYPFSGKPFRWLRSFNLDATRFRDDTERAVKHLRLLLKQS